MANEKRLIDANDAQERLRKAEQKMQFIRSCGCKAVDIEAVILFVENLECVDAVEVVRCKDCKHYELATMIDGRQKMRCENNKGIWTATQPDDFCSYGERRTDNG